MVFPTTHWSMLAEATLDGDAGGQALLSQLCRDYHTPVAAFLRARGHGAEDVKDLTQDFFLWLLRSRAWKKADRTRGRFRSFLLGCLANKTAHELTRASAQKRGGGAATDSLEALAEGGFDPPDMSDPAVREFDRAWAQGLMQRALAEVEADYLSRNAGRDFAVLRKFLPGADAPPKGADAAAELGISENALKSAIHRLRDRFRERLRALAAGTVSAPHEIDDELIYLRDVLMRGPG